MICKKIDLYQYFKRERKTEGGGYLTTYVRTPSNELNKKKRPAMLVIPGGGYGFISDREGEPIALQYMSEGYSAFVLTYSIHTPFPTPLLEACMAMIYLRENALEYSIDKAHIAAIGFSAGGHLTGMLGTMFEDTEVLSAFGKRASLIRPDAIILSYAVITMQEEWSHGGTKRVISDNGKIPQDKLSIEKRVTPQSSPAFIWHTMEDNAVPVENSLLLANAYRKEGVPFSLHIFEHGWHGLSLCNEETHNQTARDEEVSYVGAWQKLSYDWLRACGFVVKSLKNNNKR